MLPGSAPPPPGLYPVPRLCSLRSSARWPSRGQAGYRRRGSPSEPLNPSLSPLKNRGRRSLNFFPSCHLCSLIFLHLRATASASQCATASSAPLYAVPARVLPSAGHRRAPARSGRVRQRHAQQHRAAVSPRRCAALGTLLLCRAWHLASLLLLYSSGAVPDIASRHHQARPRAAVDVVPCSAFATSCSTSQSSLSSATPRCGQRLR